MAQETVVTPSPAEPLDLDIDVIGLWSSITDWFSSHTRLIFGALVTAAFIIVVLLALKRFGAWLSRDGKDQGTFSAVIGSALAETRLWFMAGVAAWIVGRLAQAPDAVRWPLHIVMISCVGFQTAIWLRRVILGVVRRRTSMEDSTGNLASAMGIIRLLVTVGLFILAAILILANIGVNVSGLLAGLGIGGIAIGLAAQGIFSDLFAALSILFDKPFRKGDLVRWDTSVGEVDYIGLKSTRIRALSGEEIIISNANLLGKELRNFARLEKRRVNQLLALVCETPTDKLERLEEILKPSIDACEGASFQRVGLETFGASSLDVMLVYDIDASDQADVLVRRNDVNLAILRAMAANGIRFAYPTQTTYTAAPDGGLVMPYATPAPIPEAPPAKRPKRL